MKNPNTNASSANTEEAEFEIPDAFLKAAEDKARELFEALYDEAEETYPDWIAERNFCDGRSDSIREFLRDRDLDDDNEMGEAGEEYAELTLDDGGRLDEIRNEIINQKVSDFSIDQSSLEEAFYDAWQHGWGGKHNPCISIDAKTGYVEYTSDLILGESEFSATSDGDVCPGEFVKTPDENGDLDDDDEEKLSDSKLEKQARADAKTWAECWVENGDWSEEIRRYWEEKLSA